MTTTLLLPTEKTQYTFSRDFICILLPVLHNSFNKLTTITMQIVLPNCLLLSDYFYIFFFFHIPSRVFPENKCTDIDSPF